MRTRFHQALESQLPASSTWQIPTLRALMLGVCDFRATSGRYMKPVDTQVEPLFEVALQKDLSEVLLHWLNQVPSSVPVLQKARKTTALVISWASVGPAVQWSRGEHTCSAEEMAHHILTIVVAGLSPIIAIT